MELGLVYPAGADERDYQIEAVESVFATWECGNDSALLLLRRSYFLRSQGGMEFRP